MRELKGDLGDKNESITDDVEIQFNDPKRKRVSLDNSAQQTITSIEEGFSGVDGLLPKNVLSAGSIGQARQVQ